MSRSTSRFTRTHGVALAAVLLALLFAGAATVATAGGSDHGAQRTAAGATVPGKDSPEAGFARDMAVHHQQAVEMSFIVRDRTDDEDVRRLAYDIANTQANQRGMLFGWLDLWGLPKVEAGAEPMAWMKSMDFMEHGGHDAHAGRQAGDGGNGALMPGMATQAELDQLAEAEGRQAEILYLQLMTDHHKGGVAMARGCAELCTVAPEKALAQGMVDAQRSELNLMAGMLKERGSAPRG
ncbi:DUF305 domain-containing protein [Streptomyces sp. SCSIO 30461]|uniref:DUF305 domain-containing protein n=1 Tax=Streptomyces sp. SCSIO 30461 TaxID=3118085 RepID=UPI0030D38886